MKAGWGMGITILYLGFITMMMGMVWKSCSQDINLVTDNYYEADLNFESQKAKINNTIRSGKEIELNMDIESQNLFILFPDADKGISGNIYLFRHSNRALDRSFPINEQDSITVYKVDELEPGLWEIIAEWKSGEDEYYTRKSFVYEP